MKLRSQIWMNVNSLRDDHFEGFGLIIRVDGVVQVVPIDLAIPC